jgi:4-amino-4-deoxy-L-arabinose transferase-like glycosyltransferase
MKLHDFASEHRYEILLCAILLLSLFLNFWNLWNEGFSNEYYAAAVRSMLENPPLAFYNSFDAAGFVTVDKPPVGLWVQALSAAIFGFSGWSVALPQALAGVCSVGLLYLLISRAFGKPAGLISAFALAITPIFVAISRNGTMDGQLIFVILLAVFIALKAAEERSLPYLLAAVVLVGVGFNIKMIQAFVVIPAILAVYLFGAEIPVRQKILHTATALLVLGIVSLSWAVAVDMTPANQRPYIDNSGDNSVFSLILNYNGIHRLESDGSMPGGGPGQGMVPGAMAGNSTLQNMPDRASFSGGPPDQDAVYGMSGVTGNSTQARTPPSGMTRPSDQPEFSGPDGMGSGNDTRRLTMSQAGIPGGGAPGNMGGGMGTGTPGALRLFNSDLAGQLSWLIPFALIGLLAWLRRPASLSLQGLKEMGLCSRKGLVLTAMILWLVPGLLYFSFTTGFWHPYYLATIAPPLAALAGIGAVTMYTEYFGVGYRWLLLPAAVCITGITGTVILNYTPVWSGILVPVVLAGTLAATAGLILLRVRKMRAVSMTPKFFAAGAIALLFLAPLVWSFTPLMYGESGILPLAGPQSARQGVGGGPQQGFGTGSAGSDGTDGLASYLTAHSNGETYLVAVPSSMGGGASLIIETGKPVMSLGGFGGNDRIISPADLPDLISNNTVRYFLAEGSTGAPGGGNTVTGTGRGTGGNSEIWAWVEENCVAIPSSEWGGGASSGKRYTLYDCAGNL